MEGFDFGVFDPNPQAAGQQEASLLDQPGARTALLQFGLNMLQPTPAGQTLAGSIGQSVGAGAEALTRSNQADNQALKEDAGIRQKDEALDLQRQKLNLSQMIAAQRNRGAAPAGGRVAAALPQGNPSPVASDPNAVPPGSTEMAAGQEVGDPAAPLAKPPTSEFVSKHAKAWETLKQRAQNGSPAERQSAATALARLKSMVADPQTVDQLLAS